MSGTRMEEKWWRHSAMEEDVEFDGDGGTIRELGKDDGDKLVAATTARTGRVEHQTAGRRG